MISTRGRYALEVMIDLASHRDAGYIPMKDVAARQDLSLKYLEQILPALTKSNLVEAVQGKGGGYRLTRDPSEIRIGDILRVTEKELAPVSCLSTGADQCPKRGECKSIDFWEGYNNAVTAYIDSRTLDELIV